MSTTTSDSHFWRHSAASSHALQRMVIRQRCICQQRSGSESGRPLGHCPNWQPIATYTQATQMHYEPRAIPRSKRIVQYGLYPYSNKRHVSSSKLWQLALFEKLV